MRKLVIVFGIQAALVQPQTRPSMFVFQDNFWLNLHQFLRGEVYRRSAKLQPGVDPASLGETDRERWTAAVDSYVEIAKRDMLFDQSSIRIHNALASVGDVARLPDGSVEPTAASALDDAAPIYRARVWPARQAANEAWIATAKALLARYENAVARTLAAIYRDEWPHDPILVNVVGEVGPNSAITHVGPPGYGAHTQVSSGSARNGGSAPLELLFHEAAHAGIDYRLQIVIADESRRQKVPLADNLWHSVIMFTSGFVVRRELAKSGETYSPYVDRYNQLTPVERSALEQDWQPYLDGKVSFEHAMHDLVRDAVRKQAEGRSARASGSERVGGAEWGGGGPASDAVGGSAGAKPPGSNRTSERQRASRRSGAGLSGPPRATP